MTLGEFNTLFKKMAARKEEEAEALIEKHLEANLAEIESELVKQSPDLAAMLKEAFELHDKGN
jgi:DNA-binding GntR family transcriptional regulator